jgi:hypothetical protein
LGMIFPTLDGCLAHAKQTCHRTNRLTAPNDQNNLPPFRRKKSMLFDSYANTIKKYFIQIR